MKLVVDSHTHSLASGHAYNSQKEMIRMAKEKGLEAIAITEHAPAMPGSCHIYYFNNYRALNREEMKERFGIEVLLGVELNILDEEGNLDLPEETIAEMDVVIASIHPPCYTGRREPEYVSKAYENILKNPLVDIVGHPDDGRFLPDYHILVPTAKKYGKLLEVNCSSIRPNAYRKGAWEHYREMLRLCMEYEQPVIINTDAHYDDEIGRFELALQLMEELKFPERLVANHSLEMYHSYISKYKRCRGQKVF
ncbi:MAG: phosphatase [Lachnospiraceae bacterium]